MREQTTEFEATLDSLEPLANFITTFMKTAQLSAEQVSNFEISADEHMSNLIEHAFPQQSGALISVCCREEADKAQVVMTDQSAGFDPRNYSLPNVNEAAIYELPPGGFGNYFLCALMDDVEYVHRPHVKNELILTIYKQP